MTHSQRRDDSPAGSDAIQALLDLYRDLDAELAVRGWTCRACATCCRFEDLGHELYVSSIEADYLAGTDDLPDEITPEICAFLIDGRCSRRERRTICCRTYYCSQQGAGLMEDITERYLNRLKRIHEQFGIQWRYARLSDHLAKRKSLQGNKKRQSDRS